MNRNGYWFRTGSLAVVAIGLAGCAMGASASPPNADEATSVEAGTVLWDHEINTGGLAVGDPVERAAGERAKELFVPVCDASDCTTIVGFADPLDVYPELAPPGDPRVSEIGYQPEAFALSDEEGFLTGYLVMDVGYMTPEEYKNFTEDR